MGETAGEEEGKGGGMAGKEWRMIKEYGESSGKGRETGEKERENCRKKAGKKRRHGNG